MKRLFCLLLLAGPVAAQPAPVYKDILPEDRAYTRKAYAGFVSHCPELRTLAPVIEKIGVDDMTVIFADGAKARHWTVAVSIEVYFRQAVIDYASSVGRYWPNYISFVLGAGNAPGILAMNQMSRQVCSQQDDADLFIPAPELSFLKSWPSDVAWRRAHPHEKLDSTVVPFRP